MAGSADAQLISEAELASGLLGRFRGIRGIDYVAPSGSSYRWNGSVLVNDGTPISLTAAQIATPTAAILADTTATYIGPGGERLGVFGSPAALHYIGGAHTIASLGGGYSVPAGSANTGVNTLVGFSGGTPKIPANMIIPGKTIVKAHVHYVKTGSAALNLDARFGTTNSFSDVQLMNVSITTDKDFLLYMCEFGFSSTTQFFHIPYPDNVVTGGGFFTEATTNVNTAADMYMNVGYNGATPGDGVKIIRFLLQLFM